MDTSPVLAQRVISRKERLQKAVLVLLVTALLVAAAWVLTGGSLDAGPVYLTSIGGAAIVGLSISAYFWFKKEERASTKEKGRFVRSRIEDDRQGRSWVSRLGFNIRRFLSGLVVLIGILFVFAGVGLLGLQVFNYLKIGEWQSLSLFSVASPYLPWLNNPQSWFGLHDIVEDASRLMPSSLALVLVGLLIAGFGSAMKGRVTQGRLGRN